MVGNLEVAMPVTVGSKGVSTRWVSQPASRTPLRILQLEWLECRGSTEMKKVARNKQVNYRDTGQWTGAKTHLLNRTVDGGGSQEKGRSQSRIPKLV